MIFSKKLRKEIKKEKKISIKKILHLLDNKSFFYFLFIITFFTSIPAPSWGLGSSTLPGGFLSFIISIQILLGYKNIYLPSYLNKKTVKISYIKKIDDYLNKVNLKKNKNPLFFSNTVIKNTSAFFILCNSLLMMIPIIFTNWGPSFSVSVISLSHILQKKWLLVLSYILTIVMFILYIYFFKFIVYYIKKFISKIDFNFK